MEAATVGGRFRREPVSQLGQGLDVLPAVGTEPQGLSQDVHVLRQDALFYRHIRPEGGTQFVAADGVGAGFHEKDQRLEDLGRQPDGRPLLFQQSISDVQPEIIEPE